jgi:hypothetical protein
LHFPQAPSASHVCPLGQHAPLQHDPEAQHFPPQRTWPAGQPQAPFWQLPEQQSELAEQLALVSLQHWPLVQEPPQHW